MTIDEIKSELLKSDYDFLRNNPKLADNIILLGMGGSYAYGTNTENSDIDIRGCALNSKREILLNEDFEQVTDVPTDTVVYSFNKLMNLLTSCNPNTIEILGLKPEQYLYLSDIGRELLDNKKMFLSKLAVNSFGGYAYAQLRRLDNKLARLNDQSVLESHILNSMNNTMKQFKEQYSEYPDDGIKLYIDNAVNPVLAKEIFMDISLTHYPLRDYKDMWNKLKNIIRDYEKVGKRNRNAIEHGKLSKHMMHLIRLYMMCADILEKAEINTYRDSEHELLMDIRNGKYLNENKNPVPEFFELVEHYRNRVEYAEKNTSLPEKPDYRKIKDFIVSVNERVVKGEI